MGTRKESVASTRSTDVIARKIALTMREDLGLGHQYFGDPRLWSMAYTPLDGLRFKRHYQLAELFKKYTFEKDVYTPADVLAMSVKKFMDNQERLASFSPNLDPLVKEIVFRAKGWIDRLLGDYDLEEHLEACYWPKKASVGVPQRKATLENRWKTDITGSAYHIDWFKRCYLPWFNQPRAFTESLNVREIGYLSAVLVDKTFKSKRMIVPNSSIGGLYSNGLGAVMTNRLRSGGYDLRVLPERHKLYARKASIDGQTATVDQTMASDNITTWLVQLCYPMRWARVLLNGRIGWLQVENELIDSPTMSTMGIGFTFPLQMVLFLGLTHACRDYHEELYGKIATDRTISCFGDDLICPVVLKNMVEHVFLSLGLLFNADKSYWQGPFRESCGGDYFHGLDVRPAYVPQGGTCMSDASYESWLYRTFNALIRRWDRDELESTVRLLLDELKTVRDKPLVVPGSYGDDAGLKVDLAFAEEQGCRTPHRDMHGTYTFNYLRKKVAVSEVQFHDCYLWEHLRTARNPDSSVRPCEWDNRIRHRARSGTYAECKTPVFVPLVNGDLAVPLKRKKVQNYVGETVDMFNPYGEYYFMDAQLYASPKKPGEAVAVQTGVLLDDGSACYGLQLTKSFCW